METAIYSSPIILKDVIITKQHIYKSASVNSLYLIDNCGNSYAGFIKKIDGDNIEIEMRDESNITISLKYSFFDGCLLDQALKKNKMKLNDLM